MTIRIPLAVRRRGGRKLVLAPAGEEPWAPQRPQVDKTLCRALVLAFRWKHLLDEGTFGTISELAAAERMNVSYVAHVLRLTLLAPELVEAILDGRHPKTLQLQPLMRGFPVEWGKQCEVFR
ncbi:hypothetical protein [Chelativorans sp.]|uniref:hypothetical protein n=1 Tax=Chelativorans sp. TaxID=2203393 RepID=UPI002810D9CA|nr:hypothetical protein [Chelativorans sp.]